MILFFHFITFCLTADINWSSYKQKCAQEWIKFFYENMINILENGLKTQMCLSSKEVL